MNIFVGNMGIDRIVQDQREKQKQNNTTSSLHGNNRSGNTYKRTITIDPSASQKSTKIDGQYSFRSSSLSKPIDVVRSCAPPAKTTSKSTFFNKEGTCFSKLKNIFKKKK